MALSIPNTESVFSNISNQKRVDKLFEDWFYFESCVTQSTFVEWLLFFILKALSSIDNNLKNEIDVEDKKKRKKELNNQTLWWLIKSFERVWLYDLWDDFIPIDFIDNLIEKLSIFKDERNKLVHSNLTQYESIELKDFFYKWKYICSSLLEILNKLMVIVLKKSNIDWFKEFEAFNKENYK